MKRWTAILGLLCGVAWVLPAEEKVMITISDPLEVPGNDVYKIIYYDTDGDYHTCERISLFHIDREAGNKFTTTNVDTLFYYATDTIYENGNTVQQITEWEIRGYCLQEERYRRKRIPQEVYDILVDISNGVIPIESWHRNIYICYQMHYRATKQIHYTGHQYSNTPKLVSSTYKYGDGTLTFDGNIKSISDSAFYNCKELTAITIPKSVERIAYYAFCNCSSLTKINLPENMGQVAYGSLGYKCFYGCTSLKSITIPSSLEEIGSRAFENCTGLEEIIINDNNSRRFLLIKPCAFQGCSNLRQIVCYCNNVPKARQRCFDGVDKSIPVYVPADKVEEYKAHPCWGEFTNILPMEYYNLDL